MDPRIILPMTDAQSQADRPEPLPRDHYRVFRDIPTRWMDNDVYGHVNNVVYYSWFDTAVNAWLIEQGALDIHQGEVVGLEYRLPLFCVFGFSAGGGGRGPRCTYRPQQRAL